MTEILVEVVGILGFATNVWANLLLARLNETGWAVRLIANVLWLAYGLAIFSLANILSSIVFAGINVYGWRNWRRKRGETLKPRCTDHYMSICVFCSQICRQCACTPSAETKVVCRNGICGPCAAQLPKPVLCCVSGGAVCS